MSKRQLLNDVARVVSGLAVVMGHSAQQQSEALGRHACRFAKNNRDVVNRFTPSQAYHNAYSSAPRADFVARAPNAKAPPQTPSSDNPILNNTHQSASSQPNKAVSQGASLESSQASPVTSDVAGSSPKTAEFLTLSSSHSIPSSVGRRDDVRPAQSPKMHKSHSSSQASSSAGHSSSAAGEIPVDTAHGQASSNVTARDGGASSMEMDTTSSSTVDQSGHAPVVGDTSNESHSGGDTPDVSSIYRRPSSSRERRVPSSPTERAFGFGSLSVRMLAGAATESVRRAVTGDDSKSSVFLTPSNASRVVASLCRMRGAALKVAQMVSLQEEQLPPEIQDILSRVRDGADIMPRRQLESLLAKEFGSDWQKDFVDFDFDPIASASIGQVHRAKLVTGEDVALKIQYPGVARSIDSDLTNIQWLAEKFNIFPKGIYMDKVIDAARIELAREVDYELEAKQQMRMREFLEDRPEFNVPKVYTKFLSKNILVTDLVSGKPIDQLSSLPQDTRNRIGANILDLTLHELFYFRFMQTDPNWSNFLYDESKGVLHLLDFGAARDFRPLFTDNYLDLVYAAMEDNGDEILRIADFLGFTTGDETQRLRKLHVQAAGILGEPFREDPVYDFRGPRVLKGFGEIGGLVMNDRLTAPPQEAYALHRKLMGSFQSCIKLGAVVPCRKIFMDVHKKVDLLRKEESSKSMSPKPSKYDGAK